MSKVKNISLNMDDIYCNIMEFHAAKYQINE